MIFSTTLSSAAVPGASTACNLNWLGGKPATVVVFSTTGGSSTFFNIQYTLDDLQRTGSSLVFWQNLSSSFTDTGVNVSSGFTFASTTVADMTNGITFSLLSPFAAVRVNSTAMTNGPLILKVIQGEGW